MSLAEDLASLGHGISQYNRLLKLTTPLGSDVLLPQRLVAHERLGRGYDYTIDLLSTKDDINLKELIAKPVTLWVMQTDQRYLPVHGYIHTIKRLGSDGQFTACQLSFGPWLRFLKFRQDARLWQDKTVEDILTEVFNGHSQAAGNFRFDLTEPVPPRSYCTQYETDWNFSQRLMEEEGWYSYHEQKEDGSGHTLVITDTVRNITPLATQSIAFHGAGTSDEVDKIIQWSGARSLSSSQLSTKTFDYKSPNDQKDSSVTVLPDHGDLPSQLEVYEYTGAYTYLEQTRGDKQAQVRVEEWESRIKRFVGVSGKRSLPVGHWFSLEDHPAHANDIPEDKQFLIIAVEWFIENNLPLSNNLKDFPGSLKYQLDTFKQQLSLDVSNGTGYADQANNERTGHCFNRFEAQRRKVEFRSPIEHTQPTLHPQTATVVGPDSEEIYTDDLNRVKVRFHWDRKNPGDEKASCWVRVSYPNAGQEWGALNVPRIGQEVIVTFLGGNADRPVITGRLYNAEQTPQWHTDGKLSGYKTKEYKGLGFNQLVLDDNTNQNRIHLYSTNTNAQLNLGYLVTQQGNNRKDFYGAGFALSTDDYGAIVTNKGLYLSTFGRPGAQGTQLDVTEARQQLKSGAELTKSLSDTSVKAGAETLAGQAGLNKFTEATEESYTGQGQEQANRFKEPILLMASPAGIGITTSKDTHLHSGANVTLSSGTDTNLAIGKSLVASVAEKISLFAYNAGVKLFAAKGKVEIQAQSNDLDLIAEKVVRLLSTTSRIEIAAKEEITISAGGSSIKINASGITNNTPGKWEANASMHSMPGPQNSPYAMPDLPVSSITPNKLVIERLYHDKEPLVGTPFEVSFPNGEIRKGKLDGAGRAILTDVPAGTGEVRFGAMPGQYERKGMEPMPNHKPKPSTKDIDALLDKYGPKPNPDPGTK
ncbi:type VI secretion system secreted protein VgrG [Undibacterium sp. GrIS 1.8]|uniref:type VI secretion system Vgr family protein n=1 Tax=unclassified Undibacterium TaxID=2630295 RepID=UPI00339B7BE9